MYILDAELQYSEQGVIVTYPIRIVRFTKSMCYDELQSLQMRYAFILKTPLHIKIVEEYEVPPTEAPPPKT